MGVTSKTHAEFVAFLRSISGQFCAETYDLFENNCNNFSNAVCNFLVNQSIPADILSLPREVLATPIGAMLRPMMAPRGGGGADPFSALAGGAGAAPSAFASSAAPSTAVSSSSSSSSRARALTPLKYTPIVSSDAGAVPVVVARLLKAVAEVGSPALSAEYTDALTRASTMPDAVSTPAAVTALCHVLTVFPLDKVRALHAAGGGCPRRC